MNIRKWKRKDFPPIDDSWARRKVAEEETDRDLQKEIQQLLCDAHEESLAPIPKDASFDEKVLLQIQRLIGAQKRMVSLMTVTAYEARKTNRRLKILTFVIAIGTILLVLFEACPKSSRPEKSTQQSLQSDQ